MMNRQQSTLFAGLTISLLVGLLLFGITGTLVYFLSTNAPELGRGTTFAVLAGLYGLAGFVVGRRQTSWHASFSVAVMLPWIGLFAFFLLAQGAEFGFGVVGVASVGASYLLCSRVGHRLGRKPAEIAREFE